MKKMLSKPFVLLLSGVILCALSALASADPPLRVARVAYLAGPVSFAPAGTDEWVTTTINRPLVTGDRLWADDGGRAELQAGAANLRIGAGTSITLLNIDNGITQLQLAQGSLNFRVRRLAPGEIFEIDTPNLAFSVQVPGTYRIDVDPAGNATSVIVRNGKGLVTGDTASYLVDPQQSYSFYGAGLNDYQSAPPPPQDEFEQWAAGRDRRGDNSISARYVSTDIVGYEDLDDQGTWRTDREYGNVWVPTHVAAGWSPYHDGHWAWIDPYGWTWVDDAPWGFAVSHYGRWAHVGSSWGWVPGPIAVRPVYAPALVAFVGGSGFSLSLSVGGGGGAVAWFPLGPRNVYRPAYPVSREYFTNINNSNTRITNTNITNVYNTTNITNITYVNRTVPGAVVAVPSAAFAGSKPVRQASVQVSQAMLAKAVVTPVAAVAPTQTSVRGAAAEGHKPPAAAMSRPIVAKTAPPPAPVPFAAKQAALTANAGKPLDAKQQVEVKPAVPAPAHPVTVVKPAAAPAAPPPPRPQRTGAPTAAPAGAPAAAPGQPRPGAPAEPAKGNNVPNATKGAEPAKGIEPAKGVEPAKSAEPAKGPAPAVAPKAVEPPKAPAPAAVPANAARPPETRPAAGNAPKQETEPRPGMPEDKNAPRPQSRPAQELPKPAAPPPAPEVKPAQAVEKNVPRPPESRPAPEPRPAAPAPKPEVKTPEPKPEVRPVPEPRPAAPAPKPEVKAPEPKPEVRPAPPRPEVRPPEPKPEVRPPAPKQETRPPEPKAEPRPAPPREAPKAEPKKDEKKEEKRE